MQHVAEGELHSWLDGALDQLGEARACEVREHLRTCGACREKLVLEEALKARADEVLALSAPEVGEAPPFETLLERARTDEGGWSGGQRISRAARLGWAASMVLALGVGWIARELGLHPLTTGNGVRSTEAPAPLEPDPRAASPLAGTVEAEFAVALIPPLTIASSARASGEVPAAAADRSASRGDEPVAAADTERAPTPTPSLFATVLEEASVPPARTELGIGLAPPRYLPSLAAAAERVQMEPLAAQHMLDPAPAGRAAEGAMRRGPPRQELASSSVATLAAPTVIGLRSRPDRVSTAVPEVFREARPELDGVGSGASRVVAGTEEAVDLTVPRLEVLRVEWSEVAPGHRGLRVLQRLASGDTLEISFVRSGAVGGGVGTDPLATLVGAPLRPGWSQVVRVHGDGWLVARAPMKRAALETLVEQVGSGR